VPFRDINNFIPYINRVWLYLSPIIWPLTLLETERGQTFAPYAEANPMFALISVYRSALIGDPFDPRMFLEFTIWAVVIGVLGVGLFVRYEGKIARHL
jgi:ABC-type polysaccharide/polyol phosphate export permease